MMNDPLADRLGDGDPYGFTDAEAILRQLFRSASPDTLALAVEPILKRLTVLEMILEDRGVDLDEDELASFISAHFQDVNRETGILAQLLYGRVATREGG